MDFQKDLIAEFDSETAKTRKMLDAIPDNVDWNYKPHPKSMSLGRLAGHLTDFAGDWAMSTLTKDKIEFGPDSKFEPYVPASKADLLDLLLDAAMGGVELPEQPSGDWRADLHTVGVRTRACLKRHPWLTGLLHSRPAFGPNRLAQFEFSLAAVAGLGLDIATMHRMVASVFVYTMGFVMLELSEAEALRRARYGKSKAVPPYIRRLIATGAFPHLERLLRESDGPPTGDATFGDGLELVLEGMAALLKPSR